MCGETSSRCGHARGEDRAGARTELGAQDGADACHVAARGPGSGLRWGRRTPRSHAWACPRAGLGVRQQGPRTPLGPALRRAPATWHAWARSEDGAWGEDGLGARHIVRPHCSARPPQWESRPGLPSGVQVCLPTPAGCPWDAHSADTWASAQRPSPALCPVTSLIPLSSCQDLWLCLFFRIHFPKQGKAADKSWMHVTQPCVGLPQGWAQREAAGPWDFFRPSPQTGTRHVARMGSE